MKLLTQTPKPESEVPSTLTCFQERMKMTMSLSVNPTFYHWPRLFNFKKCQ